MRGVTKLILWYSWRCDTIAVCYVCPLFKRWPNDLVNTINTESDQWNILQYALILNQYFLTRWCCKCSAVSLVEYFCPRREKLETRTKDPSEPRKLHLHNRYRIKLRKVTSRLIFCYKYILNGVSMIRHIILWSVYLLIC